MKGEVGVSLLEMLIVVAVLGILGSVALPRFSLLNDSFHRFNARAILVQDLKRAQAQALTEGCRGIFVMHSNNRGYRYGCDYLPYSPGATPEPDLVSFQRNLPPRVSMTVSDPMIFNSRGTSVDINDIMQNVTIILFDNSSGTPVEFARGTLLGTGLFSFD